MSERYTPVQRFHLACLFEQYRSIIVVQRSYAQLFNLQRRDPRPKRETILEAHNTALTLGLAHKQRGGSVRTAHTDENIQRVVDAIEHQPETSQRRLSAQFNLSISTINRILHESGFHPYRLRHRHCLNDEDFESRVDFAIEILQLLDQDTDILKRIVFSDEANFHVNGNVNGWNYRFYAQENPEFVTEVPLNSPKIIVWCGVSWKRIFRPFIFKDEKGAGTTVNGANYRAMIEHFLLPQLQSDEDFSNGSLFFQQDGATPHTARETMDLLHKLFPNNVISRRGDIHWPARSPDLTPLDFWMWGALKHRVYSTPIRDVHHLEQRLRQEVDSISTEERQAAILAFKTRLDSVVRVDRHHIE